MNLCGTVLKKGMKKGVTVMLGALTLAAGGTALANAAPAAPLFNGTYTAVLKTVGLPDEVSLWNVTSTCGFLSCLAHVVNKAGGSDWIFDGKQWNRTAMPPTGTCNGATVPAIVAHETLVPGSGGSLSGAVTATVDCNGGPVDVTQPLTLTPL